MDARPLTLRTTWTRPDRRAVLSAALPMTGLVLGVGLAANTKLGIALVLAAVFLPVVLTNFQLGMALWLPVMFLEGLPAFNMGAKAGGLVIVIAWLVAVRNIAPPPVEAIRKLRSLMFAVVALLVFYSCSLFWARDVAMGFSDLWHWWAVALLAVIVATTINTRARLRAICAALIVGAVLTIAYGILTGGLTATAGSEARLEGGQGDPNFFAAGIVPAIILGMVLFATSRQLWLRWGIAGCIGLLALGLVASGSRGGVLAALTAMMAAFLLFRRQRVQVLVFISISMGVAAAWFAVSPQALERVTELDSGGSGRTQLWTIAWRMFVDNPVHGVGLFNYSVAAPDYVDQPGSLYRVDLLLGHDAQVAHNVYVQALAETGAIGLAVFLAVALLSMHAAWMAAQRFRAIGDLATEMLARGIIVSTIGLLSSSFFISNGVDKRLWVLFALGPAALIVAHAQQERRTPRSPPGLL